MTRTQEIRGTVRSEWGEPLEGVLVMGLDLVCAETDPTGSFILRRPEMALFCWCSGYYPRTFIINSGTEQVDFTLRAVRLKTNSPAV